MKKDIFKTAIQKNTETIPLSLLQTESKIKQDFIILNELRDFISPLSKEEFEGLEQDILKYGISDPLIIWETTTEAVEMYSNDSKTLYILVDGHNRHKICQKHNLDFRIILRNYADMQEVKDSMVNKQLNRRNLSAEQISYYRGLKYNNVLKSQVGLNKAINTAHNLTEEFKVNEKTIRRDGEFAKGLDKLSPSLRQDVLSGKKINKSDLVNLAKVMIEDPINISTPEEISIVVKKETQKRKTGAVLNIVDLPIQEQQINDSEESIRNLTKNKLDKSSCLLLLEKVNMLMTILSN